MTFPVVCILLTLILSTGQAHAEGQPRITGFSPTIGYAEGGTRLHIQGDAFDASVQVFMDDLACEQLVLLGPKDIECLTPRHDPGMARITVLAGSGLFSVSRNSFAYIQELNPTPQFVRIPVGTKRKISARTGNPPYVFRIASGDGSIDEQGVFTAPTNAGAGLIEIRDSRNNVGYVGWEAYAPVAIIPAAQKMEADQVIKIGITGGVPPYTLAKVSGTGEVLGTGFHFRSPDRSGTAGLKATDSVGNSAEATVEFEKIPEPELRKTLIAVGNEHSCALNAGKILCWGSNADGQLGNPRVKRNTTVPVLTAGLDEPVISVVSGLQHSCALLKSGALKCWGDNRFGQLGDGTVQSRREPVQVIGLDAGVSGVVAGEFYTCAVMYGRLYCWGKNDKGQLGTRNRSSARVPQKISEIGRMITAFGAGAAHSCVVENRSAMKCWGDNNNGQLGRGDRASSLTPVLLSGFSGDIQAVTAGWAHSCMLISGAVKCWGFNGIGTLGQGSNQDRFAPVEVAGMSRGVEVLTGGQYHNCAILNGNVSCWGYNYQGQVGDATVRNRTVPVPVVGLGAAAKDVATGSNHSCALLEDEQVVCWGENYLGQLGDGTNEQKSIPARVLLKPGKPSGS